MGSSRRIEKCPQSGWGCMGGGATDHHLEGNLNPVQLYSPVHCTVYKSALALFKFKLNFKSWKSDEKCFTFLP